MLIERQLTHNRLAAKMVKIIAIAIFDEMQRICSQYIKFGISTRVHIVEMYESRR